MRYADQHRTEMEAAPVVDLSEVAVHLLTSEAIPGQTIWQAAGVMNTRPTRVTARKIPIYDVGVTSVRCVTTVAIVPKVQHRRYAQISGTRVPAPQTSAEQPTKAP